MDQYYLIAREIGRDEPFKYVKCTSMKPWDGTLSSRAADKCISLDEAVKVKGELQKKGYEVHLVSNSGIIDFNQMLLEDLAARL